MQREYLKYPREKRYFLNLKRKFTVVWSNDVLVSAAGCRLFNEAAAFARRSASNMGAGGTFAGGIGGAGGGGGGGGAGAGGGALNTGAGGWP